MSQVYENIKIPYPKEGIIRDAEISNSISTEDSVELAINTNFDSLGAATVRRGLEQYGDAIAGGNPITSLGSWSQNSSSNRRMLIQVEDEVYANNAGTNTLVRSLSNSNKGRYTQYTDYTYMVNGNATAGGDPVQTYDGTTFGTTNTGDLPEGDHIETYDGRIWVTDSSVDRLYYTDIVDPTGVITGGSEYIGKLSPQDGESFTALHTYIRSLLVFKQNHIYRVYSPEAVDPYPAYFVGTYSQESIVEAKDGLYFHHSSGFYKFTYNGNPQEISRRISDVVSSIDRSEYEDIFGWKSKDGNNICWHVGDLTLDGVDYNNVVVRYTISTEIWTLYSYRKDLRAAINFDTGTIIAPFIGTADSIIAEFDSGKSDLGEPIFYELISHWEGFTDTISKQKKISEVSYYHENAAGSNLSYKVDTDGPHKWSQIGKLDEKTVTKLSVPIERPFHRMKYRVSGETSGDRLRLYGMDIIRLSDLGSD